MKTERVCDIFARLLSELGSATDRIASHRFITEAGCGLATGKEGAHVVFRTVEGTPFALTVCPSMIERFRWQWELARLDQHEHHPGGSLLLDDHNTLSDAIGLLWAQHRGTLPPA